MLSISSHHLYFLSLLYAQVTPQYVPASRWGQASALLNDVLFVYGGKTDTYNQYSYTSAPNNNDLLRLSLSAPFKCASPPWEYVAGSSIPSTSQGPQVAWHSLSAYSTSQLLLFGGDPGPNSNDVLPSLADSADILNVDNQTYPVWVLEQQSWANEPVRRMGHSASSTGGKIWITGGEKVDGSNNAIAQHEVFDPHSPAFTQLPSGSGPPDIYGHTSIVLLNGSLVVLGGYSQSLASTVPLSTIYMLDTTSSNLQWTSLNVDKTNLPTPRRAFAAVLLDSGKILIHGGADESLQTTYSDGWILDTTHNPMIWSQVGQLSQLGARRDHLAVAMGHGVLFAFGYSSSGPAPAGLSLYDSSSDSWLTSFSPASNLSPVNTLPSSNTITGATYPPTYSNGLPASSTGPTATHTGVSNSHGSSSKKTSIAVGAVFGVLSLVVGVICGIYYVRRQHQHDDARFHMLGNVEDEENLHMARAIPVAGTVGPRAPLFGFVSKTAPTQRRDMLADEDTRVFNGSSSTRREVSGHSSISSYFHVERRVFSLGSSLASLRSVGGLLGVGYGSRSSRSREPSRSSITDEKDVGPFSDRAALVASGPWTTNDPFCDREIDLFHDGDSDAESVVIMEAARVRSPYYIEAKTPAAEIGSLPSASSHQSSGLYESLDHNSKSGYSTLPSSSDEIPTSPRTRRSSIIDANPPPTEPMRRSNTWWVKFAKTPFLDRCASDSSRLSRFVEFRDPNPPPRLVAIEECAPDSRRSSQLSGASMSHNGIYSRILHDRSVSSLQTVRTADSRALDQIGGMDVVQRDYRAGSGHSFADDNVDGGRALYTVTLGDTSPGQVDHEARSTCSDGSPGAVDDDDEVRSAAQLVTKPPRLLHSASRRAAAGAHDLPTSSTGGIVASRVQAFERRISMDAEESRLPHASERSTKNRQVVLDNIKNRERGTFKYGLAPRPSLFVANPDRKSSSGD